MNKLFIGIDFSKETFDVCFFERKDEHSLHHHIFENNVPGFKCLLS